MNFFYVTEIILLHYYYSLLYAVFRIYSIASGP